jgi:hypothetical protein
LMPPPTTSTSQRGVSTEEVTEDMGRQFSL